MADTTLYDTMAPSEGSLVLAHQRLIRLKMGGVFLNITGDVNNLALNPSKIPVAREVYGQKARTGEDIIGYNYAPSFNVEVVRDPVTKQIVAAQAWFKDLVKAAFSTGAENKRDFQLFTDALDEDMPVVEGTFSVAYSEANTGYADKGVVTFTLANDGVVDQIPSPLAGPGNPILESASPAGQTVGDLIVVRGYKLASTVSATIDGAAVTELRIVDEHTLVLQIPATVAGSAPIIVTNSVGASAALPYAAA
ncbi:IPT/TIG domain-containing protein [Microbacterium maritypicum]|uniref:IPT/TIG domain-containing protein n=1 Tax=Microbacterium TaxID=33882 RepID=UPI002AFE3E92|nr:IPT/TIG domain-containing protein [Microbacterium sp. STF-2]MEA1264251.1 IPT/TIG domain-containing protein [Microbacterium sp. STF-2]